VTVEQSSESWFCYLLRCGDGSFYVGITNDVAERLEKHNRGHGPEFTKRRRPVEMVWSEQLSDRNSARKREVELKGWSRQKKLKLIAGQSRTFGSG